MKKVAFLAIITAFSTLYSCNTENNTESNSDISTAEKIIIPDATESGVPYFIDLKNSELKWYGKKVTGEHTGTIELEEGSLAVKNDQVIGGTIVIDMNTIANTDLTDTEYNQKLVTHLKSDDFFGVEKYPQGTFTFNETTPIPTAAPGEPNYMVEGTLTLKDKTDQIKFPALITVENGVARAKATVTIDRSKFDVRYGSNTFFENLGDKAIADNFLIMFDVTARK